MENKEFIIIPEFTNLAYALKYIENSEVKFSFSVNGEIYSSNGIKNYTPNDGLIIEIDKINIIIYNNPLPGELYIDNDFLKYYKEKQI